MRHDQSVDAESSYDVSDTDIIFALALHVLLIGGLVLYTFYHPQQQHKPLQRVEVSMITAEELDRQLQHKAVPPKPEPAKPAPEPQPAEPVQSAAKPVAEQPPVAPQPKLPKLEEKPKPKPAPAVTPPPEKPKPKPKPEPKQVPEPVAKKPAHEDFDPFAPAVSADDRHKRHSAPHIDQQALQARQLSKRELERYIAMMRAAVQRHWKVPGGLPAHLRDPLVRVELARDGSVKRITLIETSGSDVFDQTLISAIRAAAPFTLPREQYAVFKRNEIRFHPKRRQ